MSYKYLGTGAGIGGELAEGIASWERNEDRNRKMDREDRYAKREDEIWDQQNKQYKEQ